MKGPKQVKRDQWLPGVRERRTGRLRCAGLLFMVTKMS